MQIGDTASTGAAAPESATEDSLPEGRTTRRGMRHCARPVDAKRHLMGGRPTVPRSCSPDGRSKARVNPRGDADGLRSPFYVPSTRRPERAGRVLVRPTTVESTFTSHSTFPTASDLVWTWGP